MIDRNTKNCKYVKEIINLITTMITLLIAYTIANYFFEGVLGWKLVIIVVVILILTPLEIYIKNKLEKHYKNKRNDQ